MTFIEWSDWLAYLSPAVLTLGVVIGLFKFKFLNDLQKNILLYLILMLLVDQTGRFISSFGSNLIILPVFSFIEMIFFVFLYNRYLLSEPNKILIGLGVSGALYIVVEILQYFVFNTLDVRQFQPYAKVADNFIIIVLALVFFYQKMNSFAATRWDNFRLNAVIMFFFTANTIIFLPFNFLVNESSGVKFYFWTGNLILTVLFYIYLTSLVYKNSRLQNK